jgi:hypothetical protein
VNRDDRLRLGPAFGIEDSTLPGRCRDVMRCRRKQAIRRYGSGLRVSEAIDPAMIGKHVRLESFDARGFRSILFWPWTTVKFSWWWLNGSECSARIIRTQISSLLSLTARFSTRPSSARPSSAAL